MKMNKPNITIPNVILIVCQKNVVKTEADGKWNIFISFRVMKTKGTLIQI